MEKRNTSHLFTREIAVQALKDSFIKLNPAVLVKNPVIFIVGIGALMTTVVVSADIFNRHFSDFNLQITLWLWFTVLFANFAEAVVKPRQTVYAKAGHRPKPES